MSKRSQNCSIRAFLMFLNKHDYGHVLTELLEPYIKSNYVHAHTELICDKTFEENSFYSIHTRSGYRLPLNMTVKIDRVKYQNNGIFITFNFKNKKHIKKIKSTIFGNNFVNIEKYVLYSRQRVQNILLVKD